MQILSYYHYSFSLQIHEQQNIGIARLSYQAGYATVKCNMQESGKIRSVYSNEFAWWGLLGLLPNDEQWQLNLFIRAKLINFFGSDYCSFAAHL